jgi:small-conductance mechanosensitive channel
MNENDPQENLITVHVDVSGLANKLETIEQAERRLPEAIAYAMAEQIAPLQTCVTEQQQALDGKLATLKDDIADKQEWALGEKLAALENKLAGNQHAHHDDLAGKLGDLQDAIRDMADKLKAKAEYDEELHQQVEAHQQELDAQKAAHENELDEKKRELTETISNKEAEIARLNGEIARLQDGQTQLAPLQQELDTAKGQLNAWTSFAAPYLAVKEAVDACPALESFRLEEALQTPFDYIRAFGKTLDFATRLFDKMVAHKKETQKPMPMTGEEQNVYAAVNVCYRETCGIEHDVFALPGQQSMQAPFQPAAFEKTEVDDLFEPKNKNWKYAKAVYVPTLFNLQGGVQKPGKVKAANV